MNGIKRDKIALIRYELRRVRLQEVAEKLQLSYGCLYSIREGKTNWPQLRNINKLLNYFNLEFEIRHKNIQDKSMKSLSSLSVAGA